MAKVLEHLYLSGYPFAANKLLLETYGISHIVNMAYEYSNTFPNSFQYLHVPAKDVTSERLGPYFHEIAAFVATAKNEGGKVLVHCQQGISRSAAAVLACMIINEHTRLASAFRLLKLVKPDVEPNPTFLRELRMLENDTFGEYCRERLTVVDQCEEVVPMDWKEGIAIILAKAAMAGIPFDASTKECQPVWSAFEEATTDGEGKLESLLERIVITSLESFGGQNERDVRARRALEELLTAFLPAKGFCTLGQLKIMLRKILEDEALQDLSLDVPKAKAWVAELVESLEKDGRSGFAG
jgi:hypothetical protein